MMACTTAAEASMSRTACPGSASCTSPCQIWRRVSRSSSPGCKVNVVVIGALLKNQGGGWGYGEHRQFQAEVPRRPDRQVVADVGMAHHAAAAVGNQHAFQAAGGGVSAVGHDHHAGVLAV